MKLFDAPHSPYAARVRTQIYAKGISDIDIVPPPGFGTPAYKEINTTGKIPALEVDGMVIPESMVIMEYLEQVYPQKALRPTDAKARAVVNLMARFPDVYIQPALFPLFREVMQKTGDQDALKANIANLKTQLKLLDDLMGQYNWGTQAEVDFADCALAPTMFWAVFVPAMFGENAILDDTPRVKSWWERCKSNAVIGKVLTEMEEGYKAFVARFQK